MSRRIRVYLTLSIYDADLLADHLDAILAAGYEGEDAARLEKMLNRLRELTEAQRPSLAEGMFDGPPADYAE